MQVFSATVQGDWLGEVAAACLAINCVLFSAIFLIGRKGGTENTARRDTTSRIGLVTQMVAYAMVFAISRNLFSPIVPMPKAAEAIVTALTISIGFAAIWFCYAAVRTLGKQWALMARVIEGHELITAGPYGVVRNPIYLGMFGFFLEVGLTLSAWQVFAPATVIFLIGTQIRIRSEEKILRDTFGEKFDDYARRVPAFFPRIF